MSRDRAKKKKTLVDAIVTTAGAYDKLEKCLESLDNQTFRNFTLCLIDGNDNIQQRNANREILDKNNAKMLGMNVGFPKLANEGARMGKSHLMVFIGDDVTLPPTALEHMVKTMKDETIGVLGIKLLFPEDSVDAERPAGKVQHIGLAMDVEANVVHPLLGWSADNPRCCISRDCFAVTGAVFMTRRSLFNRLGGFDEDYGLGTFEDVSYCLAARAAGFRSYVNTDIVGYHHVGATAQQKNLGFPLQRNKQMFRAKWEQSGLFRYDAWEYV